MQVREAMTHGCETVRPSDTIRTAAQRMRDMDIGDVLVSDEGGQVLGIITDRDIAVRGVAEAGDANIQTEQVMTRDLLKCYDDDDLVDAARKMEAEQVRRLLVCDRSDRPMGVLSQADIALAMGRSEFTGEMVEEISQPGGPHSQSH